MEFLNPAFWIAGAAIAAPIIIHLLNRQRYKKVEWAAMRFIVEAVKRTHRRLKLEEIILLILRCLILLFLVLALSRPYLSGSFLGIRTEGNFHAVVAIDATYSMEARIGNQKLFDRAKEMANQIAGTLKRGDKLSVVIMSHRPTTLHADPTVRFEQATNEIADLTTTHFTGTLDESLDTIKGLVAKSKPLKSHLFILTDNQARFWNALQTFESKKTFHELTTSLGVRTSVIDVGGPLPANLTVAEFKVDAPILTPGASFRFAAEIANYSQAPVTNAEVSLHINGERLHTQSVSVDAGQTTTVTFSHMFAQSGSYAATVQLEPDALATDNQRHLALMVEESVKILVVDPAPAPRDWESETYAIRLALNPQFSENKQEIAPFRCTLVTAADLGGVNLKDYSAVILANVGQLSTTTVDALTEFVKAGGGLLTFVGPRVDVRHYTDHYYRSGAGFLAAPLTAKVGDPSRAKFLAVDIEPTDHPIPRKLKQENIQFELYAYQYLRTGDLLPESQVIATYGDKSPAIVERKIGKGRSVLVTTSCSDTTWSEMVLSVPMIVVIQEYGLLLASGSYTTSNIPVGDKFTHTLPSGYFQRDLLLVPPSGEPIPQAASQDPSGQLKVSFAEIDRAGIYRLQEKETLIAYFAANVDPTEGDLTRISTSELEALRTAHKFSVTSYDQGLEAFAKEGGGKELWMFVLSLLALLMFVEMFFAWKFGAHKK
jgi:hypothetical protein